MTRHIFSAALALGLSLVGSASLAQDCKVEGDPWDLDDAGVNALYSCIEARMIEGYTKGDNPVAAEYRTWAVTATRPAVAGPHGERFLYTFANDTAAEQYLKFEEEGVVMPVGSILAKESITIGKKGKQKDKARPGPLFIMEKVAAGTADEFGNWVYSAVQPNGKPMKIKQSFCSNCHVGWEAQDHLGYPLEDVRVSTE